MTGIQPRAWAAIDVLRFACALLVVAHHYCAALPLKPNPAAATMLTGTTLSRGWSEQASFGWVGVELFFVISGYVIACSAVGASPRDFLHRRAQRLLPAAWVCATLTLTVLVAMRAAALPVLAMEWVRSISFWPLGDQIDPSYWTLGIEVAFYLLVAWRLRGGAEPARIERVAWWVGGASLAFWLVQIGVGPVGGTWLKERSLQLSLILHGAFFAVGILLHGCHRDGVSGARLLALALFGVAGVAEIVAHAADQAETLGVSASPVMPLAAFALGVAVVAGCRRVQPWLGWCCRWSATLGLMTYPVYLLHQQVGAAMAGLLGSGGFPAALLLVTLLSWLVVRHAEPPLRRWIGRVSARHALQPDTPPSAFPSAG